MAHKAAYSTRNIPINPKKAALVVIDVQELSCRRGQSGHTTEQNGDPINYYFDRVENILFPNLARLLRTARSAKMEVIYTVIESLTQDGRDSSLDYKLSNLVVPKGSPLARVCTEVAPEGDEMVLPKTSCSVFNSTVIEYILRNQCIDQLVVAGVMTNQCIESAVRDAADRGFLVTTVEDACACKSLQEEHSALHNLRGFSRLATTQALVEELEAAAAAAALLPSPPPPPPPLSKKRKADEDASLSNECSPLLGEELRIAVLRPEDDPIYGQSILTMFQQLLGPAAAAAAAGGEGGRRRLRLEDFPVKGPRPLRHYPARPDYAHYHGVLIPGSLNSAYDDEDWIHRLAEEIRYLNEIKKPLVGVCFGHQLVAHALGGRVRRNPRGPQRGPQTFRLSPAARQAFLYQEPGQEKDCGDGGGELSLLHHNNDIVTALPENLQSCSWKASSQSDEEDQSLSAYSIPMYSIGDHILASQGHPEFSTPHGRECLKSLLQKDYTAGNLPGFQNSLELEKWMEDSITQDPMNCTEAARRWAEQVIKCFLTAAKSPTSEESNR